MSKKLVYFIAFVFVCGLYTSDAAGQDENLVLHLRFDEGSGAATADASATGLQATLEGDYEWTAGRFGQAVAFTDGRAVLSDSGPLNVPHITVMAWVNPASIVSMDAVNHWENQNSIYGKAGDTGDDSLVLSLTGSDGVIFYVDQGGNNNLIVLDAGVETGQWQHIAATYDGTMMRAFLDGEQIGDLAVTGDIIENPVLPTVGGRSDTAVSFDGAIDDVRVYDRALTADEIQSSMGGGVGFPFARKPDPQDGAVLEATWANLAWRAGDFAVTHDLYFGTSFDDVNDGVEGTFAGNLALTFQVVGFPTFPAPDGLLSGTTYYWRVDEVNDANAASPWKGDVWSFVVPSKKAYEAAPADGGRFVDPEVTLGWAPGFGTKLHHVYFGDNADDVAGATGALPQPETTFAPDTLEMDKTYYWRVDEFDGFVTQKGDVWSFTTQPIIAVHSDPDLVAWWTLDEGEGAMALDWSGHGNHATLVGPKWSDSSVLGDAALYMSIGHAVIENLTYEETGLAEVTVSAWIRTNSSASQFIISFDRDNYWRLEINGSGAGPGQVGWDVMTSSGQVDYGSLTRVDDGAWHHVCGVFDNGQLTVFIDGLAEPSASGGSTFGAGNLRPGIIGGNSEAGGHDGGTPIQYVDDIRIYSRALTQEEIVLVMRGDPLLAWSPSPSDGSTPDIDNATPLTWSAGDMVSRHDVYFGLDRDVVANADTSDTTGVYRGSQAGTSFTPAEGVEWGGGPYYWRVDENNTDGTVTEGRVWTFTAADFILVDDIESYTDDDAAGEAIWQHWIDGFGIPTNGAQAGYLVPPYAEQTIINGGGQSMPLLYDNTAGVRNSEAVLALTAPRNWTNHGVAVLSLWYRGYPPSVGSFTEGPVGTFTMTGSGADIWTTLDEFHFAYKTLTGPGTIVARVDSIENTHAWAKAGVMIRETLDADSKYSFAVISAASGVAAQGRIDTGIDATGTTEAGIAAPHWVKLERDVAGFFTISHSTNGSTWVPVAGTIANNIPMGSDVYIGLAVTSHDTSATCEAKFSNVTMTGNVGAQWTNQDIGILANAAEPFYVSLSNANGTTAVVANSDANAAVTDVWTEWQIDLSEFADQGVNLADVDKIAVGLGATGDPAAAGGSGTMFIDDIVLLKPAPAPQP